MNNRNIIFIMLDTVRADVLKPYGGDADVPNMARLSDNGIKYNMAIAPGTYTLPSHLSLFLGKRVKSIPELRRTGMKFSDLMADPFLKKSRYNTSNLTIAQVMEYFGYKSALFSNNPFVSESTGLATGFSHVSNIFIDNKINANNARVKTVLSLIQNDHTRRGLVELAYKIASVIPDKRLDSMYLSMRKRLNRHFSREYGYYELDKGAATTNRQLAEYLKHNRHAKNFIFVNYMEGHEGYPTNLITSDYVEQDKWLHMTGKASGEDLGTTKEAYRKRIEYLDRKVGDAISMMGREGILDEATLIVSSDHGQAFMEHGHMFHNVYPYNEVTRVPLIIANFKNGKQVKERKRIDHPFSLTDLNNVITGNETDSNKPVFSDHIGITEVWDTHLLQLFRKRSANAEMIYRKKVEQDRHVTAIYGDGHKLIHYYGKRPDELYSIDDLEESSNLIDKKRGLALKILAYNKIGA